MLKLIRRKLISARRMHWGLGILEMPIDDIVAGKSLRIQWIKNPYKDRWFADPFILDFNDDKIELLVEEFCYSVKRGRIAKLSIDRRTFMIADCKILLDINTHLSFPFIFRDNGKVYIMPENFESGKQSIYEYDPKTDLLSNKSVIYCGQLTDASIIEIGGRKFVLSTEVPGHNGDELKIFELKNGLLSPLKSIVFDENTARNAGAIFKVGNKLYRPAQVCNHAYGEAVEIQEMKISGDTSEPMEFVPAIRIKSTSWAFSEGLHTFNTWRGMTIIDVHGYRKPLLGKSIAFMASIARRFKHIV